MKINIYCLLCLLYVSCTANAQHKNEIGVRCDNDAFLARGSDCYYTGGFFFYYLHALRVDSSTSLANKVLSFELGQKIFTPYATNNITPSEIDRPYASYLYIGSTLNLLRQNESNIKIGARLGVVGPAACGKTVQNTIHSIFGFYKVNGWQYQVQNDVELNLSGNYNKLVARTSFADASLNTYVNVGNGFTGAGVGTLLRLGKFNQLFNSVSTQSSATCNSRIPRPQSNEWFVYYQPYLNLVVYDATIEGSLFKNNIYPHNVTLNSKLLNLSQQLGLSYTSACTKINLAVFFKTRDVKQMTHSHQWGSVSYFYRFG